MQDEQKVRDCNVLEPEQQSTPDGSQPGNIYEQMCVSLYAYRYGAIGFLDLIVTFEESLGLTAPLRTDHSEPEQSK